MDGAASNGGKGVCGVAGARGPVGALLYAKARSDRKDYGAKHRTLSCLLKRAPGDFYVDSRQGAFVGLTHRPSGFRIHMPSRFLPEGISQDEGDGRMSRKAASWSFELGQVSAPRSPLAERVKRAYHSEHLLTTLARVGVPTLGGLALSRALGPIYSEKKYPHAGTFGRQVRVGVKGIGGTVGAGALNVLAALLSSPEGARNQLEWVTPTVVAAGYGGMGLGIHDEMKNSNRLAKGRKREDD